jgi:lysophospholipase L1-like esterase
MASTTGYGDALCARFTPETACHNLARGGRSSGSFRAEKRWDEVMGLLRDGAGFRKTYVLIQFGHNDQPGKPGRSTDYATEFPANMKRYVEEARAAGGVPVLVTPLTRRSFKNGYVHNDLAPWAGTVREIARSMQAPLVDLNALSLAAVQAMGPKEADKLARTGANFDYTHLGPLGAERFSGIMARELARKVPALSASIRSAQ